VHMRKTVACSVIGAALAVGLVAAPGTSRAASSTFTPSGRDRAGYELPRLEWEASQGLFPKGIVANQTQPAGLISKNIQFLSNLPLPTAISIAFIGHTAFVSTVLGVYSVDISNPSNPQVLGALPMYIWENEFMQADPQRNLIFIARDPRGFTSPLTTAFPYGALHVIDVSNPRAMVQVGFHLQPTGHTAACINNCTFLWVTGPASPAIHVAGGAQPQWGGRPTWGLDITNPTAPKDCPHFIDVNNHDGATDYDHHVDVDSAGVAWVTGSGHIRGYWTNGRHYNYVDRRFETATACNPIPYAGGNTYEGQLTVQGGVIHDSERNMQIAVDGRQGDVVAATEEVTVTDCAKSGQLVTYDIGASKQAQGWIHPKYTLPRLGVWTPHNQPGSTGCDSAHWFTDRGDGLLAQAFYTQGTRLVDIRDPRHIKQVGWYNVKDQSGQSTNDTWATYWYGRNYIVVADFTRGLDILRYLPGVPAGTVAAPTAKNATAASAPPGVAALAGMLILAPAWERVRRALGRRLGR